MIVRAEVGPEGEAEQATTLTPFAFLTGQASGSYEWNLRAHKSIAAGNAQAFQDSTRLVGLLIDR